MISNLDPAAELFLANVERVQERLAEASRQVSSGKKMSQPADAPDQIDSLLQLRSDRQRNQQIHANLALAQTQAASADGALASAIKLMDRARTLAAQGGNSVLDASARRNLAGEAQSLLDQMIAFSQTAVEGRYIFSGDRDDAPAYRATAESATGAAQMLTAGATRRIESPAGGSFAAGKTAQEIFDPRDEEGAPAADNVFGALNALAAALAGGEAEAAAGCVASIEAASARLNSMQAFYGTVESRIEDAQAFAERYDIDLTAQLSQKEDADVAAAALEETQANTQLQAAFQMRAGMSRRSLFEYIG